MHPANSSPTASGPDYALLLLLAFIWSSSFLLIKVGVQTVPPLTLAFSRIVLAAIVLTGLAYLSGEGLPKTKRLWALAGAIGLIGFALPFTLIHWGEKTIDSGLAALLMGVMPIWVVVLAHFFTGERITLYRSLGVVIAFAGLILLVGWEVLANLGGEATAQLAVIAAAICYAISAIVMRRHQPLPLRPVAAGSLIAAALALAPMVLWLESPDPSLFSTESMLAVAMLGIVQTGLATLISFHLIARVGATLFSQINYLIPVLGVGWGIALLGEQPGWQEASAMTCILIGLILVNQRKSAAA